MNFLFAHDHTFKINKGEVYSSGGITSEVLDRYRRHADSLTVVSRQQLVADHEAERLTKVSSTLNEFQAIPNIRSIRGLAKLPLALKKIWRLVRDSDAVVARLPSSTGQMAAEIALLTKRRLIVEVVGCAWDASTTHGSILGKISAPFAYIRMRTVVSLSTNVIYITRKFLQRRYPASASANVAVCPNVSLPSHNEETVLGQRLKKITQHSANNQRESSPVLGLVGSLDVNYKGHETLIKAMRKLSETIPGVRAQFVGPGDKKRWVHLCEREGVANLCDFLGPLSNGRELFGWMDHIDLLVQPSLAEGQGRVIIEAMSRACPVIASRVGGIVELIDDDALVSPGDANELSDRVEVFLVDSHRMASHAHRNLAASRAYEKQAVEDTRAKFIACVLLSDGRRNEN